MVTVRVVNCPQCGKPARWEPANGFRPFCSERCKLIDLGAWANESYRVPLAEPAEDNDATPPESRLN